MTSLAVIDPIGNAGGGNRFIRQLLPAIHRARPELIIRFSCTRAGLARDGLDRELREAGIEVSPLEWGRDRQRTGRRLAQRVLSRARRELGFKPRPEAATEESEAAREIEKLAAGADLVFFPWPYFIEPPATTSPLVATIHDLNFRYFFGTLIFSSSEADTLDRQVDAWARRATTIVSSEFMAAEVVRSYPGAPTPTVIRLAPFVDPEVSAAALESVGLRDLGQYVLCGTHLTVHKNVGPLIAAQALLRERFPGLRLVITGAGTEAATGRSSAIGSARSVEDPDVIGLGYVSNAQMDALINSAVATVNPSLYEAGNGSGVDAWRLGTPVAMSDIPSFREHLPALGVQAALFDPRDPADIAQKIGDILDRPEVWAASARASRDAIQRRSWDGVAADYLAVFDRAISGLARG